MTSRRTQKAAQAIREVVSMAILADLKDPRIRDVTVTSVDVSPDMRQARIHVSVMGDDTRQQLSLRVELVAFTLEEPPYFGTTGMGS